MLGTVCVFSKLKKHYFPGYHIYVSTQILLFCLTGREEGILLRIFVVLAGSDLRILGLCVEAFGSLVHFLFYFLFNLLNFYSSAFLYFCV